MTTVDDVATSEGAPQRTTGQFGVVVFLASDVMLFAPFFAAYFLLRSTNSPWPAENAELDVVRAGIATLVLVASSFTIVVADRAYERGDLAAMRRWLAFTGLLGSAFLVNQIVEYVMLEMRYDDGPYASVYWGITMLHTAHVTAGVAAIALLFVRAARTRAASEIASWANGVSLFWHLVDVIWLGVFVTVWVIR